MAAPLPGKGFDVLVVDDDETIRNAVRMLFQDAGYTVSVAPDAAQALNVLRGQPGPHVVILDHLLPLYDGDVLVRAILTDAALSERTRFVYLTAVAPSLPMVALHTLHQHGIPLVEKPFDTENLLAVVERVGAAFPPPDPSNWIDQPGQERDIKLQGVTASGAAITEDDNSAT